MSTYFRNHAELGGERAHLRFLKWILGVNKKTTNTFCWGELGEFPLIYCALEQAISYYKRVKMAPEGSMLHHTINEQKQRNMKWWVTMTAIEDTSIQDLKKQFEDLNFYQFVLSFPKPLSFAAGSICRDQSQTTWLDRSGSF